MKRQTAFVLAVLVLLIACAQMAQAQTVRVVRHGRDSALVITTTKSAAACDSARYTWQIGDRVIPARALKANTIDTFRVRGGFVRTASADLQYTPLCTVRKTYTIPQIMLDTIAEYRINRGPWKQDKHAVLTSLTDTLETRFGIYNAAKQLVGVVPP